MSPTAPRRSRSPLAAAIVAEAVRRIEADGPLDDAAALAQAFRTRPTRGEQLLERALLLGQRLGLPAQLARGRQAGWGVLLALALLVALTGLGLARAVLGEGRHITAVAAFVSLLGLHGLTLALWLLGLLLPAARRAGAPLGRLALWLTAHLPLARGPHALTLLRSLGTVLGRHGLLIWLTGAISHGIWALAFVITLVVLLFGFAFHAYTLSWESTILGAGFFQRFVQLSGALPALLGFPVPDAAAVQQVGNLAAGGATGISQRDWAWWLMGCVAVYGLLPRALLACFSAWRWRAGQARLARLDMTDPYVRVLIARLDALEPPPQVIDAEQRAPAGPAPALPTAAPGAPGTLAVIGFELPPEQAWPLPGLPTGSTAPLGIAGGAAEREAALAQLAAHRPDALLLAVHAPSSPDRGTARFLREALPASRRAAVLALGAGGAGRWRDWLDSESFQAVALVQSAPAAIDWIASGEVSGHA